METRNDQRCSSGATPPNFDIRETNDDYAIVVDLPGATSESLDLNIEDGVLTLTASVPDRERPGVTHLMRERATGTFTRRFNLGEDIDTDGIVASLSMGVLRIALPKRAETRARNITISG